MQKTIPFRFLIDGVSLFMKEEITIIKTMFLMEDLKGDQLLMQKIFCLREYISIFLNIKIDQEGITDSGYLYISK